jgi:hypothetical protein
MSEMSTPSAKAISSLLKREFPQRTRPKTEAMFRVAALLPHYLREFECSASLDLETALPSDVTDIYETNCFYTAEGFLWRFPQAFDFAIKWRGAVVFSDFVDVIFSMPRLLAGERLFSAFNTRQRLCAWLAYECLDRELSELKDLLEDDEEREMLSQNLFGQKLPPYEPLAAMRREACELAQ